MMLTGEEFLGVMRQVMKVLVTQKQGGAQLCSLFVSAARHQNDRPGVLHQEWTVPLFPRENRPSFV